jgi:hypothetical protein
MMNLQLEHKLRGSRRNPVTTLRMPIELKERVVDAAQRNFRSINNELIQRIAGSFEKENAQPAATDRAFDAHIPV